MKHEIGVIRFVDECNRTRDTKFGTGCTSEVYCRKGAWFLAMSRLGEEVFRVPMGTSSQSEMDFVEIVYLSAGINVTDFVNAENVFGCHYLLLRIKGGIANGHFKRLDRIEA